MLEALGHWLAGIGGVGALAWMAKRFISKLDGIDLLLRGDGNGNPGLSTKIRKEMEPQIHAVHQEVKNLVPRLERVEKLAKDAKQHVIEHDKEAEMWKRRIEATESRCDAFHQRAHPGLVREAVDGS